MPTSHFMERQSRRPGFVPEATDPPSIHRIDGRLGLFRRWCRRRCLTNRHPCGKERDTGEVVRWAFAVEHHRRPCDLHRPGVLGSASWLQ